MEPSHILLIVSRFSRKSRLPVPSEAIQHVAPIAYVDAAYIIELWYGGTCDGADLLEPGNLPDGEKQAVFPGFLESDLMPDCLLFAAAKPYVETLILPFPAGQNAGALRP